MQLLTDCHSCCCCCCCLLLLRRLTRPSATWTPWVRTATRTARSSCSCCVTTSRCGPARCRTRRRLSHQRHKRSVLLCGAQRFGMQGHAATKGIRTRCVRCVRRMTRLQEQAAASPACRMQLRGCSCKCAAAVLELSYACSSSCSSG
jgi:hypothetical protein